MTKLPSLAHSLTSGAPVAAPMDSASALAPSTRAGPCFDPSKRIQALLLLAGPSVSPDCHRIAPAVPATAERPSSFLLRRRFNDPIPRGDERAIEEPRQER